MTYFWTLHDEAVQIWPDGSRISYADIKKVGEFNTGLNSF
jgi:hypothetical protein